MTTTIADDRLAPYVSGLAIDWLQSMPATPHRRITGSLAFVDISGFTSLTERLAAHGKVGAEEMSDLLNATFATLLASAYSYGALLVKWGGDAVLLLFEGPEHALLACRAADEMRRTMRQVGRLRTSAGVVQLRMSVGISSGEFDFFLVGERHRELLVTGPASTETAHMEQVATAGEIVISRATAALMPAHHVGAGKGDGHLLRGTPAVDGRCRYWPPPAEATDLGLFLDPAIRDHLRMEVGDSEHRHVAVGFVEVSRVDDLLSRQGPGAVASALHELIVRVQRACERHRVTFWETDISADGFKVMLVAGAPRGSGHDEEGMLRAAAATVLGYDGPLGVRVGVNCGRVFSGAFGPAFRRTWSVKGDAVNLAARVMGKAGPGELLATLTLLDRAGCDVAATPLAPFPVKGKQHLVHASAVTQVRGGRVRMSEQTIVGRDPELASLRADMTAALAGAGRAVAVSGEPGIGKTALVDHVVRELPAATSVLRAAGDDYEQATPYFVAGQIGRAALRLPADAPDDKVVAALHRVADGNPRLQPWLPLLAMPFGIRVADTERTASVQDEFRARRAAALFAELLETVTPGPTVLLVDDLPLTDEASLEVIRRIVQRSGSRPWLVLLVGRALPAGVGQDVVDELRLGPVSQPAARAIVLATDSGRRLSLRALRSVVARGDGNPLFLTALAQAADATGAEELPETVEELLTAQVDDLPPALRRTLRVASVLGMRFDPAVVADLLGGEPEQQTWEALGEFIVADGQAKRFRNTLARDAAYEGLPFRARVDLHGRAADAIVARVATPDTAAAALSMHCLAAHRFDAAWHYARVAGDAARGVYANVEALTFYHRARAAARRLPALPAGDLTDLLAAIGDVHARLAEVEPALAAYREARRRTPRTDVAARARLALSAALALEHTLATARINRWLSVAHRELAAAGDDRAATELDARIWLERAYVQFTMGRDLQAAHMCRSAIDLAESLDAYEVIGRALHLLDNVDLRAGRGSDEQRMQRALQLFVDAGDLARQGVTWNHLGLCAYYAGDWVRAVRCYEEARQLRDRCGDEWAAAIAAANIGEILVDQGRLAEAEPLVAGALDVWRASGIPSDIGFGAALLGRLYVRLGRTEAWQLFSEANDAYAATGEPFELVDLDLRVAEALLLQGSAAAARERLKVASERLREAARAAGIAAADTGELPATVLTSTLLRLLGIAAIQLGDRGHGTATLTQALTAARERGAQHDVMLAIGGLEWANAAAAADLVEAAEIRARLGVVWLPHLPVEARDGTPQQIVVPEQRSPVERSQPV